MSICILLHQPTVIDPKVNHVSLDSVSITGFRQVFGSLDGKQSFGTAGTSSSNLTFLLGPALPTPVKLPIGMNKIIRRVHR
ncbi:hypothetical protein BD779DRAFT_1672620 [Infundibulicybe gibba]|nr:hypothetical protein BD779DRAFT_1672620 [Infundibulicybe gibba]